VKTQVLVVDDEPHIRLTLTEALAPLGYHVLSASDGAAALRALEEHPVGLMLLDLRMPDMDGMEVLRRAALEHPDTRVAILTAHGSVANALEAMRLGAVDFLQKPVALAQVRAVVRRMLDRETLNEERATDYEGQIELAKKFIGRRDFSAAREPVLKAIARDSRRPEAYNLLGVLEEIAGHRSLGQDQYRMALAADATYRPAQQNLARSTQPPGTDRGPMRW